MPNATIASAAYNASVNDVASALSQSIATTGQTPMAAALNLGGYAINNVANPVAGTDAVNLQSLQGVGGSAGGFVNKLRNATFDVWQRGGGPISCPVPAYTYTADGWQVYPAGAAVTAQEGQSRGRTIGSLRINGAAGCTQVQALQRIESYVAAPLANQTCTFQAWIYNNSGISITPQLQVQVPNTSDNWAGGTSTVCGPVNLQPCANGAWTQVAYTFAMPAGVAGVGPGVIFNGLVSGYVCLTECDLRVTAGLAPATLCPSPPPAELRPVHEELLACQRYYVTGAVNMQGYGGVIGATAFAPFYYHPLMRAANNPVMGTNSNVNISSFSSGQLTNGMYAAGTATAVGNWTINQNFTTSAEL